jgi:hypothetical protein
MSGVSLKDKDGRVQSDAVNVTTVTASSGGNTTIETPTSGKSIRVYYIELNADGGNAADVTASLRFTASGSLVYTTCLVPGAIYARNISAGRKYIQGATDEALILNLSTAQTVNATVEWEEVD